MQSVENQNSSIKKYSTKREIFLLIELSTKNKHNLFSDSAKQNHFRKPKSKLLSFWYLLRYIVKL